jgi:uncharacterized protein YgfB (UPF0149 family)
MIDVNKEAYELYPENWESIMEGKHDTNSYERQAFIAGHNSKATQAKVLQAQIDVLKEVDFNMYMLLKNEATNLGFLEADAIYKWNKTAWHLKIKDKIEELQQQLKQLENE